MNRSKLVTESFYSSKDSLARLKSNETSEFKFDSPKVRFISSPSDSLWGKGRDTIIIIPASTLSSTIKSKKPHTKNETVSTDLCVWNASFD